MKKPRAGHQSEPVSEAPELPTDLAFVLQLSRDSGRSAESFIGRVEHLATGRRLRFVGLVDFQTAVIRLLTEARSSSGRDKT